MKPGFRSLFLLLVLLFTGWMTSVAAYEVANVVGQDELYDSRLLNNEGSDDADDLNVIVNVPELAEGYLSLSCFQYSSITQPVLLLEARAPPGVL